MEQAQNQTISVVVAGPTIEGMYNSRAKALETAHGIKQAYGVDAQVIDFEVDTNDRYSTIMGDWI